MINSTTRHSKLYRDFIFTNFFNKFIYENDRETCRQNDDVYQETLKKISMRVFQNFNENLLPLVNKVLMYNELNNNPIISSGFKKHKIRKF